MENFYRVIVNPNVTKAAANLAKKFSRLEDAIRAMAEGLVLDSSDSIVAFHERHLELLERGNNTFKP